MNLSEAMSEGLMVTGTGLIIVFSVLVILMLVMMAMKKIFYKEPKKTVVKEAPKAEAPAPEPVAAEPEPQEDPNLIAVIAAAVAAAMDTPVGNLKIKSYRRVDGNAPAWNKAGLRDVIDSRF